jgi:hypothetical protein
MGPPLIRASLSAISQPALQRALLYQLSYEPTLYSTYLAQRERAAISRPSSRLPSRSKLPKSKKETDPTADAVCIDHVIRNLLHRNRSKRRKRVPSRIDPRHGSVLCFVSAVSASLRPQPSRKCTIVADNPAEVGTLESAADTHPLGRSKRKCEKERPAMAGSAFVAFRQRAEIETEL